MNRFPSLRRIGLAVEHFPRYVNRRLNLHGLDVVLLSHVVAGRGRHVMDDLSFDESGGSLAVTHYGQRHALLTDEAGMEVYNVYLDLRRHPLPSLPTALRRVLPEVLPLHPSFQNRLNRRVRLELPDPQRITTLVRWIERELAQERPGADEAAGDCLRLLLIESCRLALEQGVQPSRAGADPPSGLAGLERVRRRLDERFDQPQSLAALAELAGVSPGHLCRSFKAYTGRSVFAYLTERRVQGAMLELRSGDQKVLAVAMANGFNDASHFNRSFKRLVGRGPAAYRRQHRRQDHPVALDEP
jgi:AraC-like DNA-binding protein